MHADGIMVARGDLGVEIPFEQHRHRPEADHPHASLNSRPVITATHMLESMITNRRPTRAEVTDVANAIIDGTDCVMLSGETSIGQFPVDAVAAMTAIARLHRTACHHDPHRSRCWRQCRAAGRLAHDDEISLSVLRAVEALGPDVIFGVTTSGTSVRRLARFDLGAWIVAICCAESTAQDSGLLAGRPSDLVPRTGRKSWAGLPPTGWTPTASPPAWAADREQRHAAAAGYGAYRDHTPALTQRTTQGRRIHEGQ